MVQTSKILPNVNKYRWRSKNGVQQEEACSPSAHDKKMLGLWWLLVVINMNDTTKKKCPLLTNLCQLNLTGDPCHLKAHQDLILWIPALLPQHILSQLIWRRKNTCCGLSQFSEERMMPRVSAVCERWEELLGGCAELSVSVWWLFGVKTWRFCWAACCSPLSAPSHRIVSRKTTSASNFELLLLTASIVSVREFLFWLKCSGECVDTSWLLLKS